MMKLSTFNYVSPLLVLFYLLFVVTVAKSSQQPTYMNYSFPAVIAFGDSILDTGNNNYILTALRSNFKPYGRDFFAEESTGRFCNGRIPSDFYVEILGIKDSMPPYLDPDLEIEDLLSGVSFASAGSGYDPLTVELASVLSTEDQLEMFKEYIGKLKGAVGEERTAYILEKSIVLISMGSNDIAGTYFLTPYRRVHYNVQRYTRRLIRLTTRFILELYRLGARRIGTVSLSALGCIPMQRTVRGGIKRNCVEPVTKAAQVYNSMLYQALMDLKKTLSGSRIVYLDVHNSLNMLIQHPNQFGFESVDRACCGIASMELGPFCSTFSLKICKDASKYVFWDSYHPTERTYGILTSDLIKNTIDQFV